MKLLNRLRSLSKSNHGNDDDTQPLRSASASIPLPGPLNPTAKFPRELVHKLLAHVCPHSQDASYLACEESMIDGGCMLCDVRDLASCALVNRQWGHAARNLLYSHVRIDSVHYCERGYDPTMRDRPQRNRHPASRNGEQRDPPHERLVLFSQTVRASELLAYRVQSLKIAYMTRESSKADIARAVCALPNLRYVDLPEGVYSDSPATITLKQELQIRCPNIRKMKYMNGAEDSFTLLAQLRHWPYMESLELHSLSVDPSSLLHVLSSLPELNEVDLSGMACIDDSVISSLPALRKLSLRDAPSVSIIGISKYLLHPQVRRTLASLSLINTGISSSDLHRLLSAAPLLTDVLFGTNMLKPFPITPVPPLNSSSLKTLHYEISSRNTSSNGFVSTSSSAKSHYIYLSQSLQAGTLPALTHLYALYPDLSSLLLSTPPPVPPKDNTFKQTHIRSSLPLASPPILHPLHLYTKSLPELEWQLTVLPPTFTTTTTTNTSSPSSSVNQSLPPPTSLPPTRPLSLYMPPPLSPQYRNTGRESVTIGNGFGGYLTVPSAESEPVRGVDAILAGGMKSPKSPRKVREKDGDAWMG